MQIKQWAKIAEDGVRKREGSDVIRERILAEDENMRRVASCLMSHPILKKTVIQNSVQGFVDSASRFLS